MSSRFRFVSIYALLAALVLLAAASPAQAGFKPSLNKLEADKGEIFKLGCLTGHTKVNSGSCRFGDTNSRKKVVVLGDSHAMQWGPALIKLAKRKHWQVIALTRASCPPAMVRIDYYCDTWRRNSMKRIRKMKPGLVLVSTAANPDLYKVNEGGSELGRAASESYLVDGMVRTLKKLRRWSGKTVVMRDQAVAPFNVTMCLRSNVSSHSRCNFNAYRPKNYSYDYKAARQVPKVQIIDPMKMLCPGGRCRAVIDDYIVYRNRSHMSATFIRSKYRWLGDRIGNPWGIRQLAW